MHHWAHIAKDCDTWHESESEWHLRWKSFFPDDWLEVVMGENREHRADIRRPDGLVIELQHSSISLVEAQERCEFYKKINWIFDAQKYINRCKIRVIKELYPKWYSDNPKPDWFNESEPQQDWLALGNPADVWARNSEFHSNPQSCLILGSELPKPHKYWGPEVEKTKEAIAKCTKKLKKFNGGEQQKNELSLELEVLERKLAKLHSDLFLKFPVPSNTSAFSSVQVAGADLKGVPLKLGLKGRKREATYLLECPFFWDFNEDYILFFPAVSEKRASWPFDCVLLEKIPVIRALGGEYKV